MFYVIITNSQKRSYGAKLSNEMLLKVQQSQELIQQIALLVEKDIDIVSITGCCNPASIHTGTVFTGLKVETVEELVAFIKNM